MRCRHHPVCPGCPLLGVPYAGQLAAKRDRLDAALRRYPHLGLRAPEVRPAVRTDGYRHRLKLPVHVGADHVAVGLYDRHHPGRVLDTPDCPVLVEGLRAVLGGVVGWLRGQHGVHSVDLRWSDATGEAQLVLACEGGSLRGGRRAVEALRAAIPAITSVAVSSADPDRKRVMGRRPQLVSGTPHLVERIGDTAYRLLPGSFFQADPRNAVQLHALVRDAVGNAATVLDLYAGVGAYALALAPGRRRVLAVEEVPQAAASARAMAPSNVEVVASRVEDLALDEPFDAAVLNPARRGSDPTTMARVARLARRVVYVSCGPETLARDLDAAAAHGLRVVSLDAIDLFPQTAEVEAVAVLERGEPVRDWAVPGGRATGPWLGRPSGALGRPDELVALVIGDPGREGRLPGATFVREAMVATHGLVRIRLRGPPGPALDALRRRGHPPAGEDPRTAGFFAEKAGLLRPFLHVARSGSAAAPLHGDLTQALDALR